MCPNCYNADLIHMNDDEYEFNDSATLFHDNLEESIHLQFGPVLYGVFHCRNCQTKIFIPIELEADL